MYNDHHKKLKNQRSITGKVDHVNARYAYIVVSEEGEDVYVNTKHLLSAVHGDTVAITLHPSRRQNQHEGRVIKVIKRNRNRFVGRTEIVNGRTFAIPDFRKAYQRFFIPKDKVNGATPDDKIVFEVTHWGDKRHTAAAVIVKSLGKRGNNEAEIHSIMAEFDLPFQFSRETLQEIATITENIPQAEQKQRRDFRKILTFTIDPDDAQDFDDALSVRELSSNKYEIGIHIADVSHYVRPGTALDREARSRGTSVYMVDRTIPMLPERLSNQLCSLRPDEEKRCFSIVLEIDNEAHIYKTWFGETTIHSDYRLSYEQAQKAIETGVHPCTQALNTLNNIARRLRKNRADNGAINFETTEMKFVLDANKKPLALQPKVRKEAHKLVEEFMLLANRAIASHMIKQKTTFIYRTHDSPDREKVADFANFTNQFGYRINIAKDAFIHSINALMKEIEGKPEQNILQKLAIRTMTKAKYTTEPKQHFGLAFTHYTHFTSPIRRYPDLVVHRMVKHMLTGKTLQNSSEWEAMCAHCTAMEKKAIDAERTSIKYKQVELMSMAADKVYEGIITGIADFGIFVELLETSCEGVIKLKNMKDDFYEPDKRKFRVIGRRKKKTYRLGDMVKSRIKRTDINQRIIELTLE